jgi:hypothetical protein
MLSGREREVLQDIERQIAAEDPRLAAALGQMAMDQTLRWTRRGYNAVIVVGASLAAVCLSLPQVAAVGAGVMSGLFAVYVWYLRKRRFPPRSSR